MSERTSDSPTDPDILAYGGHRAVVWRVDDPPSYFYRGVVLDTRAEAIAFAGASRAEAEAEAEFRRRVEGLLIAAMAEGEERI